MPSLEPLAIAAEEARASLRQAFASLLNGSDAVAGHVSEKIRQWQAASAAELKNEFPFALHEQQLANWRTRNHSPPVSSAELASAVDDYAALCKAAKMPDNQSFWQRELDVAAKSEARSKKANADITVSARLLLDEWQKVLDKARVEWELERISTLRRQLMADLEAFLQLLQQLHQQLEMLGMV